MMDENDLVQCQHCGNTVPYADTSEGMCSVCPDEPIDNSPATVEARRAMFEGFGWPTG